jgi:predicted GIY-YIG superfamily endonuclease
MMSALIAEAQRMAPSLSWGMAVVYFLRLRSGIIYIGSSSDFEQRLEDHASGHACRTTQLDPPVVLLRIEIAHHFPRAAVAKHSSNAGAAPRRKL